MEPTSCRQKHLFSYKEDQKLIRLVHTAGEKIDWKTVSIEMNGRTARQCRERYKNYLDPSLKKEEWTSEEDSKLIRTFLVYGNTWRLFSPYLPGRSTNSIRNRALYLMKSVNLKSPKFPIDNNDSASTASDSSSEIDTIFQDPIFDIPEFSMFNNNSVQ